MVVLEQEAQGEEKMKSKDSAEALRPSRAGAVR
jgi:hypothetical protein